MLSFSRRKHERGAAITEYAAILSLVGLLLVASLSALTVHISTVLRMPPSAGPASAPPSSSTPLPVTEANVVRGDTL